jgi:hypothetical protein
MGKTTNEQNQGLPKPLFAKTINKNCLGVSNKGSKAQAEYLNSSLTLG